MKKHDLYELMQTLTTAEKKAFKEKYSGKEDGNFMRLYQAILNGEATNDTGVKQKFKGEKFVSHLHKTKAYLYEAILQVLQPPMQQSFSRFRILQKIEFAETLLSRKLISQAEDTYTDALAEAQQTEEIELELFIRIQLTNLNPQLHRSQKQLNDYILYQQKLKQHLDYSQLFYTVHSSYISRGKKGGDNLAIYAGNPLLKTPDKMLSPTAQRWFEITQSLLFTVDRDYNKALKSNLNITNLIEPVANTSVRSETAYISALFNAGLSQESIKVDSSKTIARLEKFDPAGRWAKSHRFVCLVRLKLNQYLSGKRTTQGKSLIKWIEQELPLFKNELNEQDLIKVHISIATLYMKEQDYNRALDFLLQTINAKTARENRLIVYRVATLYQLIAYYELHDYNLLAITLRNYKYFQKTNDSFYLIEKMTLDFFNTALRLSDKKQRLHAKRSFESDLLKKAKQQNNTGLAYLKHIDWIDENAQ